MRMSWMTATVLAGALGCASGGRGAKSPARASGGKPDWVTGASAKYPREMYLTGVGIADDQTSAQDRARGEISKIFSTQVSITGESVASESTKSQGDAASTTFSQTVSQSVHTASQQLLEGVAIAQVWQDPEARSYYALATLDRQQAEGSLRDRIADFDKQMGQWKGAYDGASARFEKIRAAMKLLHLAKARSELDAEFRVLNSDGRGIPSTLDAAAVEAQAAKTLSELDILVKVSGDGATTLETGLVGGLTSVGLSARDAAGGSPDVLVEATCESRPIDIQTAEGWKRNLSAATVTLKDAKAGKIFLRFDESDREDSASAGEAARRSSQGLSAKVAKRVEQGIRSYFENQ